MTQSDIELELDLDTMNCTPDEVAAVFNALVGEMRAAAPYIRPDEREVLRRIMAHESESLTVGDIFLNFTRESDAHTTLRRLRTAQFIRPAGRDIWESEQVIAIRPFARLAWDRLGEAAIFGDEPEHEPEADVDLALPGADEPDQTPSPRPKERGAERWDDDDVLDFLSDSPKKTG